MPRGEKQARPDVTAEVILALIAQGLTRKQVASKLKVAPSVIYGRLAQADEIKRLRSPEHEARLWKPSGRISADSPGVTDPR